MSEWKAANDNAHVTVGSGNVFLDLGFEAGDAERAMAALAEFRDRGGVRFKGFKAELDARNRAVIVDLVPKVYGPS